MTDNEFKKAISEALCDEYIDSIPEHDADHEFSDEFHAKMNKLVKRRKKPYYRFLNTAFKRTAATAAVILLIFLSPLTVKAVREGAYDFILRVFSDHAELSVATTDSNYPKTIETVYTIPYFDDWDMDVWINDKYEIMRYYTKDDRTAFFDQYTIDHYVAQFEKDYAGYEPYTDKDGSKYLIDEGDTETAILWNNREYVFFIMGDFTQKEALEVCRSMKIEENSELLSQQRDY